LPTFRPLDVLPAEWQARLVMNEIVPVTSGMSGAHVFRVRDVRCGDQYLKIAMGDAADYLRREVDRTEWLAAAGICVPKVLMRFAGADVFALTMTALTGQSADCVEPDDWPPVVRSIARAFAGLHSLAVDSCPFDETLRVRLARAHDDIRRGAIDASHFDPRNLGMTPGQLHGRLEANAPAHEDCVVVHGDATLSNLILRADGKVGFVDCGNAGRADRYVDLAPLVGELEDRFGGDARSVFLAAYGDLTWDEWKSRFYRDLYELF
jgi:aminoglycoside 3'-phosphotransferase-2